jgi:spermidine synthase
VERFKERAFLPVILIVFTASGFAGLIYESIWSHYLKLFLGHAAYAQTLVLAIFMGGMALGAWLASRWSARWKDLLVAYALVETTIGVITLGFHELFVAASAFAFDRVIPALDGPLAVLGFKWTLAALLILPQSVLLGMTFPLMTGGVLRLRPERTGYVLAMLYFTNSLGGAAGVLASGFYFIGTVGLPGTLAAAAVVNLGVAALVMLVPRSRAAPAPPPAAQPPLAANPGRLLLAVAALTGLSSFMYEIGWIRMLSLVLGSSTHAFELMLSAFILGIACGGLWIRRRIDAAGDTVRLLGVVQVLMGIAALATLPVYGWTFRGMELAMQSLSTTDKGYFVFNLVSHGMSLAVMFPASFCAGMTLPLITACLLRRGAGERAIGQVYGANTAGAIAGVVLAVHVGLPYLGLKGLIIAGAAVDLALGVVLLAVAQTRASRMLPAAAGALSIALLLGAALGVQWDAASMASGVFRMGFLRPPEQMKVEAQIDGKTSTVSLVRIDNVLAVRTNGKSDGAIAMAGTEPASDEIMMTLLGALPQVLAPEARRVANIGFGTGMTTHVLLASDRIEAVDTIEIEPAMVRVAAGFRPFNARALDDPRSRIHYDDAKTYFSSRQARYDVIVSEPSNPWVSGVAGLFSTEFYRDLRRYLTDEGLLFQWVHSYEMTPLLLGTIMGALEHNFSDYELWLANDVDLIIVAAKTGRVPRPDARAFDNPRFRAEVERFGIRSIEDLRLHRLGGAVALAPYFASLGVQANSDFYPVLDLEAPRARFVRARADELLLLLQTGLPLLELFDERTPPPNPGRLNPGERPWLARSAHARQAGAVAGYLRRGDERMLAPLAAALSGDAILLRAALVECRVTLPPGVLRDALASIAWIVNQHLPRTERDAVWKTLMSSRCSRQLDAANRAWLRLHAAVGSAEPAAMAEAARAVLDIPAKLPPELTARVLAARIAGLILTNRHAEAQREFAAHRGKLGDSATTKAMFRYLVGQGQGARSPRAGG